MDDIDYTSINIEKIQSVIDLAIKSESIFCIGVDGPTASGKTVFAGILKEVLQKRCKKKIQIVQLDCLLVDRSIRENALKNISMADIVFEHEAELHMDFTKISSFLNELKIKKKGFGQNKKIFLKNMYSREKGGRCVANLSFELDQDSIFIFEGHYTTRPDFHDVLDCNIILLANRNELIARKVRRVSGYRDAKSVEKYFALIDEPSYLSNYFRFATNASIIIDNSVFKSPKLINLKKINTLLNTEAFFSVNKLPVNKYREFIFGLHGLSNYCNDKKTDFEVVLEDIGKSTSYLTKRVISDILRKNSIENTICFIDHHSRDVFEASIKIVLGNVKAVWIIHKSQAVSCHLIFWKGGAYKIKNGQIDRLLSSQFITKKVDISTHTFWSNISKSTNLMKSIFFDDIQSFEQPYYCFLRDSSRLTLLSTAFSHTQFRCSALGDFFIVASRQTDTINLENFTVKPEHSSFDYNLTSSKKVFYEEYETSAFLLNDDFLILTETLNKKIFRKLKSIYFKSNDTAVRRSILEGLLATSNSSFVPEYIVKRISFLVGFFPMSMTRIYSLRRMGIEESNVLATNIYDITENSIDASSYLEAAKEHSLPIILQVSLNAVGQMEFDSDGNKSIGYLKPRKGVDDFTNSIANAILKMMTTHNELSTSPLIGIGLDHVDIRGDVPIGRSKRFVDSALKTEMVTHLTLDGSAAFKPSYNSKNEIGKAYTKVFKKSLEFLNNEILDDVDLEFCTGELNYIGNETVPHYPSGKEIAELPLFFNIALDDNKVDDYSLWLKNMVKLYVCNLGTTHHGNDQVSSLRLDLASEWQENLKGTSFVSPVLHGTTGSSSETLQLTSANCQKINIAGSLLKVMLESLSIEQKKLLGFKKFDANSKKLCTGLEELDKDKVDNTRKALKSEYISLCDFSKVKPLSSACKPFIKKPLFGRNKIATYLFDDIEGRLSDGKNISSINDRG